MKIMDANSIKSSIQTYCNYLKDRKSQRGECIRFYNWIGESNGFWMKKFIESRKIPFSTKQSIAFFSVFGEKFLIKTDSSKVKVFFTGENVHRSEHGFSFQSYENYALDSGIDLALGFDYEESDSYLRFPLWLFYLFNPEDTTLSGIKKVCNKLSDHSREETNSKRFCSLVSGHDPNGLRKEIYDSLHFIDEVSCGGRFMNNTDELKRIYNNNKIHYLEQFKFNICPENSNTSGYVTEKIMEAIMSGAIPIYWGSDNHPEREILNQDAIIFWNKEGDNAKNIELINSLHQTPAMYKEFYSQPRLKPDAAEVIYEIFSNFESKLRKLASSKDLL